MDIMEKVCDNVYNYRVHAGPPFPYLKGVKSLLKQALERLSGSSGLPLKTNAPEERLNDPTSELRRMFYQCHNIVEEHEEDITEWYMDNQDADPIRFLCAQRVLAAGDAGCLHASTEIPHGFTRPAKEEKKKEKKVRHYEL